MYTKEESEKEEEEVVVTIQKWRCEPSSAKPVPDYFPKQNPAPQRVVDPIAQKNVQRIMECFPTDLPEKYQASIFSVCERLEQEIA